MSVLYRGMHEFNCVVCGEYKVITSKTMYKYKIFNNKRVHYCCSYDCWEIAKGKKLDTYNEIKDYLSI